MVDIDQYCYVDNEGFDRVWHLTQVHENQHNLISEMIAKGDLLLLDPKKLFWSIGHFEARVVLYYLKLEIHLHFRRQRIW
jgi:hypothetical protein